MLGMEHQVGAYAEGTRSGLGCCCKMRRPPDILTLLAVDPVTGNRPFCSKQIQ